MDKVLVIQRPNCGELPAYYESDLVDIEIIEDVISALYKIKKESYRLIIIDMASSRICGLDLLRIIRSNPRNHKLKLAIAAQNYNYKFISECFNHGADFFLKMPLSLDEIEDIIINLNSLNRYVDLEEIARCDEYNYLLNI